MKLTFTIPGSPVGKQSIRIIPLLWCDKCEKQTSRRQCRCGNERLTYRASFPSTETKTKDYMALVRQVADFTMKEQGITMLAGPLSLTLGIYVQIAETRMCKKHEPATEARQSCKKLHDGDWCAGKPDCSNVLKGVEDAMNTVVFPDDRAICNVRIEKRWSVQPRCEVTVCSM
jgi:Holliday junction resolvase RusA-like endonuclease